MENLFHQIEDWIVSNQVLTGFISGIAGILSVGLDIARRVKANRSGDIKFQLLRSEMEKMAIQSLQTNIRVAVGQLENPRTWEAWSAKGSACQIENHMEAAIKYFRLSIAVLQTVPAIARKGQRRLQGTAPFPLHPVLFQQLVVKRHPQVHLSAQVGHNKVTGLYSVRLIA